MSKAMMRVQFIVGRKLVTGMINLRDVVSFWAIAPNGFMHGGATEVRMRNGICHHIATKTTLLMKMMEKLDSAEATPQDGD